MDLLTKTPRQRVANFTADKKALLAQRIKKRRIIYTDYIRREAVIRIKHLENKNKMEMQILKVQLGAALLDEEKNKILLKKANIESEKAKIELEKAKIELEKAKIELEKAKIELEKVKK